VEIFTFSNDVVKIPPRRGFTLRDAIVGSQPHGGTYLGKAVAEIDRKGDRPIVFADPRERGYMERGFVPARRRARCLGARARFLRSGDCVDRGVGSDEALTKTDKKGPGHANACPGPFYFEDMLIGTVGARARTGSAPTHSHSIVPGGLDVTSYTTLFTPLTSLMIRVAVSLRNFMSKA